jgi:TonB-linked SusC/RagA family outer membrane protein
MITASRSLVGLALVLIAFLAPTVAAQNYAYAGTPADTGRTSKPALQRASGLVVRDVSLGKALGELTATSGVAIAYSPSLVSSVRQAVSCNCANITVGDALELILRSTGFVFTELRGQVLIFALKSPLIPERSSQYEGFQTFNVASVSPPIPQPIAQLPRLAPQFLSAQVGRITGRVTDSLTHTPVVGAEVKVVGTRLGNLSDDSGQFTINGVPAGDHEVSVHRLGFAQSSRRVHVGDGETVTVEFALVRSVVTLDVSIVTATGSERLREIGSSVGRIRADSIALTAPISNLGEMLGARIAGVDVQTFSGTSIGRSEIRIRGVSSPSLSNAPLVYMDGVRVNADPSMPLSNNSLVPSRLNDINPAEIESIDVLRGPSAATLYGTEAARGVILITTKRGKTAGTKAQWRAWTEGGRITEPNQYPSNYRAVDASDKVCLLTSEAAGTCTQTKLLSFNMVEDPSTRFFKTGKRSVLGASVASTTGLGNYFVSSEFQTQSGVYDNDAVNKVNVRGNFTIQPTSALNFDVTTGYLSSRLKLFREGGTALGPVTNALLGGVTPTSWFQATPQQIKQIDTRQDVDRFTGGATIRLQPATWVQLQGTFGLDANSEQDKRIIPPSVFPGARAPGIVESVPNETHKYTSSVVSRFNFALTDAISSRSSVGSQFFRDVYKQLFSTGSQLVPGTNSISAAALTVTTEQAIESRSLGFFLDQQFGYRDRLFLTTGLRTDNNSSFGKQFKLIAYPNVNASWVISEEPFFPSGTLLSSLRLRSGWGESGSAPGAADAVRFFSAASATTPDGSNQIGVTFLGGGLGNPHLKPERASETELGFDAGFLSERVTLALTYYNKSTKDALIFRDVAPSVGATSGRWENLAKTRNRGVEATLDAGIFQRQNADLRVAASAAYNQNRLLELGAGIKPILVGSGQRLVPGYPLAGYWDKVVTAFNDANNDGIIVPSEITVSDTAVYLGEVFPPFQASIQPVLGLFQRVRISGLLDIRTGNKLRNLTEGFRCGLANCRARFDKTTPLDEQARWVAYALKAATGEEVESDDFARLRELSIGYSVPRPWTKRARLGDATVTLAGQNLAKWTKYSGIDPEPMIRRGFTVAVGRAEFGSADFTQPAPVRTWILRVNMIF